MNPILVLETTTRWRRAKSFFHLFLLVLAIAALISYVVWVGSQAHVWKQQNMGRHLLGNYALGSWFLLLVAVPALTAPAIAGERQQGTLASLTLSHLSPLQILWGKLAASLLFPSIALLSLLPPVALAFGYGGVGPEDLLQIGLLHGCSIFACASLALSCSTRNSKVLSALVASYEVLTTWCVITAFALSVGQPASGIEGLVARGLAYSNPLFGLWSITYDTAPVSLLSQQIWQPCVVCLLAGSLYLRSACRAMAGPFERQDEPQTTARGAPQTARVTSGRASNHSRVIWTAPFTGNAIFRADMKYHLRGLGRRIGPLSAGVWLALAILLFLAAVILWPPATSDASLAFITFISLPFLVVESGHAAVSIMWRDKFFRVWEQIQLTPMKPKDIVAARIGALITRFVLVFAPVAAFSSWMTYFQATASPVWLREYGLVTISQLLIEGILGICLGLYFGLRLSSLGIASSAVVGTLILSWIFRIEFLFGISPHPILVSRFSALTGALLVSALAAREVSKRTG